MAGTLIAAFGLGWYGGSSIWPHDLGETISLEWWPSTRWSRGSSVVESNGDPNAKNKRSSAMGLGQFLDETWLDLIRTHRPDLARGRSQDKILELRRDAKIAREITMRFTEQNAGMLRKRGLPVTPGTLYLAHFAGGAGAVAILSALGMPTPPRLWPMPTRRAEPSERRSSEANPFLERFTVADLRSWADRKMRVPGS